MIFIRRMTQGSNLEKKSSFSRQIPPLNDENDIDEVHATRHDHNERIWENILALPQ